MIDNFDVGRYHFIVCFEEISQGFFFNVNIIFNHSNSGKWFGNDLIWIMFYRNFNHIRLTYFDFINDMIYYFCWIQYVRLMITV